MIDSFDYEVADTVTYGEDNKRSTDLIAATRQFPEVEGNLTYLSRADHFANYDVATAAPASLTMPEDQKAAFINNSNYDASKFNNPDDVAPLTGQNNGMKLADLRGKAYDDPLWVKLMDQMTIEDMNTIIALAGYMTSPAPSVGKVGTTDCDGLASINNNFTGVGSVGFPSGVMIAATWNEGMAKAFGESIGEMADEMNVAGWYAPRHEQPSLRLRGPQLRVLLRGWRAGRQDRRQRGHRRGGARRLRQHQALRAVTAAQFPATTRRPTARACCAPGAMSRRCARSL